MIRNIIIKVTLDCNIQCKYCYVHRNREYEGIDHIMGLDTLEALIIKTSDYLKNNPSIDRFVFYWHGGEPLLAGTAFFEEAFRLQKKYMPENVVAVNTIQTNGTLLNEKWIDLIKKINYGICLSLDGPAEINDVWRRTIDGKGTYHKVVDSIKLLNEHNIPLSVLSVITPEALPHGRKIYHHLRQLGFTWMDFMYPFYSLIDNTLDENIDPAQWGFFYKDVFDAWIEEADPDVDIRLLRDLCLLRLGGKTSMCSSSSDCSYVITVDPAGNIYVCDDLLSYSDSMIGNILTDSLFNINCHPKLTRLSQKSVLYGDNCQNCSYFPFCKGGCTLFRAQKKDDFHGKHYFCAAQRIIIDHINDYFQSIASTLKEQDQVDVR